MPLSVKLRTGPFMPGKLAPARRGARSGDHRLPPGIGAGLFEDARHAAEDPAAGHRVFHEHLVLAVADRLERTAGPGGHAARDARHVDDALVAADETVGMNFGDASADAEDDDNADLQPCSRADCCMRHLEGDDLGSWGRTKRDAIKLVACEWLDAVARPKSRMRSALSDARAGLVSRQFDLMPLDETLARLRYAVQAQREHT